MIGQERSASFPPETPAVLDQETKGNEVGNGGVSLSGTQETGMGSNWKRKQPVSFPSFVWFGGWEA